MSGYIGPAPVPQATQTREAFTATSGQTTFNTGGYTAGFIDVYLNGVKLAAADYTATNGSDVVLAVGAAADDILETVAYSAFTVADQDFTGETTAEDLTVTGAFTSQGIDDNATSTAMTLDSSGNLLVGTTSTTPQASGEGIALRNNGYLIVSADGSETRPMLVNRNTNDGELIQFRKDGTAVGSIGTVIGYPYITDASRGIRFNGNNIRPCSTGGANLDNTISLGDTGQRFKDLYLSGGVYLGGVGSANHLDDYEEGTWTPVVQGTTTAGTSTYTSTYEASYVKIGKQVTVTCNLVLTSFSGAVGNAVVTGLPFTAASGFGVATGAFECDNIAFSSGYTTAYVVVFGGQAQVSYRQHGSSRTEAPINVTQVPAGNWQRFSITYFTT